MLNRLPKKLLTIGILVLLAATGCASKHDHELEKKHMEEAQGRAITKSVLKEAEASRFVEIQFNYGSSLLTERAKVSLSNLIKAANDDGKINEVVVLSWSDAEYPSKSLNKLPKMQQDLAAKRNENVFSYVKGIKDVEIVSYNMAEKPTRLQKLFNTDDTKIKNSLVAAGLTTTADRQTYANKASHSVILVK